ncbi:hypothetical protein O9929_13590 [Vibrio lentus]|nr:hypothetical protein [Vibrio lentus]
MATQLCDCEALQDLRAELTDRRSMYKRMKAMDTCGLKCLFGLLRHHADADMLLKRIAKGQDIHDLRVLAKYTEPAPYYARNWEGARNSTEPKGHFMQPIRASNVSTGDALPVESYAVWQECKIWWRN